MSEQLLLIMALVVMSMTMPLHTGDLPEPCEKQGDPAKIQMCKFMRLMAVCAADPAKAWCCVPSERERRGKEVSIACAKIQSLVR